MSTLSENLPLRMLLYIGRIYEKVLESENIYRHGLVKIPRPDFIVLYNGNDECPDRSVKKLSDAFEAADVPGLLELTVTVYNINEGRNPEILRKSKAVREYAAFIGRIKENRAKELSLKDAIGEAVKHCIKRGIMKDFLEKHASEVENMLFAEFDIDDAKRIWREEAMEQGVEKGKAEGFNEVAVNMLKKGISPQLVADCTGLPLEKVTALKNGPN
jgi:hypothetical protein